MSFARYCRMSHFCILSIQDFNKFHHTTSLSKYPSPWFMRLILSNEYNNAILGVGLVIKFLMTKASDACFRRVQSSLSVMYLKFLKDIGSLFSSSKEPYACTIIPFHLSVGKYWYCICLMHALFSLYLSSSFVSLRQNIFFVFPYYNKFSLISLFLSHLYTQ